VTRETAESSVRSRRWACGYPPAVYQPSARRLDERVKPRLYQGGAEVRRVDSAGFISLGSSRGYVGESFVGVDVELQKSETSELILVRYANVKLGHLDISAKPFTRSEVMARTRAALRRAAGRTDAGDFDFRDLTIRPRALAAERNAAAIDLTPREISMLRLLRDHRGEAVSRDAILDACWGVDDFPDSRTLDQHDFLLRRKIEADPANPALILSVRGVGYRYG
jgi:hypothetical protein